MLFPANFRLKDDSRKLVEGLTGPICYYEGFHIDALVSMYIVAKISWLQKAGVWDAFLRGESVDIEEFCPKDFLGSLDLVGMGTHGVLFAAIDRLANERLKGIVPKPATPAET